MTCILRSDADDEFINKFGYYLSLYGLFCAIGILLFILLVEAVIYKFKIKPNDKLRMICSIKGSLLAFFITV